jgi:hypothetical protein
MKTPLIKKIAGDASWPQYKLRIFMHPEGSRRVAEATRGLGRGGSIHEESAQRFVLALPRARRLGEEAAGTPLDQMVR